MQNFGKNCDFKIWTYMKISESIAYVISQQFFFGGGGREIGQEGGEILPLPKVSFKKKELKISRKSQH